jgi:CheY-like chemotaxis protein
MKPEQSVLLVEDDRVDAMTVQRALRELNSPNPLHHVTDGEKALAYLHNPANPRPGLILLDLNMPRMNGLEFLARVKNDDQLKVIPVVVLTTSREEMDRAHSFGRSVAGYMIKPVDYDQFVEVMRTIKNYWMTSESAA